MVSNNVPTARDVTYVDYNPFFRSSEVLGDKYDVVNVLADPYDVGYGAVSRARNLTLLFNRAKLKITTSPRDMYRAITDQLNKNQTSTQSMFLETDVASFQYEIESVL